jgi:hypothetical protein
MSVQKTLFVSAALLATMFLCGCGVSGGADIKNTSTTTTLGQELKDLKDAHDKKIISDSEYEDAKERIIKQRTSK